MDLKDWLQRRQVLLRAECHVLIVGISQLDGAVGLVVGVVLTRHMIGHEVGDDLQAVLMRELHQSLELLHAVGDIVCQVGIYVEIVLDGIGRARTTFHHSWMIGLDAKATIVGLRGMLYDACVPDVGSTQFLDLLQGFRREVGHLATAILSQSTLMHRMLCLVAEKSWQHLVYDDLFHNQLTIHN